MTFRRVVGAIALAIGLLAGSRPAAAQNPPGTPRPTVPARPGVSQPPAGVRDTARGRGDTLRTAADSAKAADTTGVPNFLPPDSVMQRLMTLGGYGEFVVATIWALKPKSVSWEDAGALPASVEAAVRVLRALKVSSGETLLLLGAGGSVGMIATQLALRQGLHVIAAVGEHDEELVRELGATPVRYGSELLANVRKVADHVDATFDAAGKGGLEEAITLTDDRARVITLADERARDLGVAFSSWTPDGAPDAIAIGMERLANGELQLRSQRSLPMSEAAEAHRLLEEEGVREKLLLTTAAVG